MKDYLIKQLRECSFVKGKQKTRISKLSDDQLYALFLKIRNQESAKSIAQYIQKAWGINPDSTVHSISQGVLKFKDRISHLILTPPPTNEQTIGDNDYYEIDAVESLEEMEHIAKLQRSRIQRMMLEEQELGIKHSNLSRDLQSLATLSKVIVAQKQFEIMHGNNDPIKRRRRKIKERDFDKSWKKLMKQEFPTEEDKEKMLGAIETMIERVDEISVPLDELLAPGDVLLDDSSG